MTGQRLFQFVLLCLLASASLVSAVGSEPASNAPAPRMLYGDASRHGRPFAKDPSVIRFGGRYLVYDSMAPSTNRSLPKGWAIGIAESRDLVHWEKTGEILPEQDCEKNGIVNGRIILLDGRLHLFYNTYGNGAGDALCHATSKDGIRFDRDPTNPVWHPTGGWNNGLCTIDVQPDGEFKRVWTPAADAYKAVIQRDLK